MRKLALLAALAATAVSVPTLANDYAIRPAVLTATPSFDASTILATSQGMGAYRETVRIRPAHWFVDPNGVLWSNICSTPNFWVALPRHYVVGSGCVAFLVGYGTAPGIIVQG